MRINVYHEEITNTFETIAREAPGGHLYYGLRVLLKTHPDMMMPTHQDDDNSAVTFWFDNLDAMRKFTTGLQKLAMKLTTAG